MSDIHIFTIYSLTEVGALIILSQLRVHHNEYTHFCFFGDLVLLRYDHCWLGMHKRKAATEYNQLCVSLLHVASPAQLARHSHRSSAQENTNEQGAQGHGKHITVEQCTEEAESTDDNHEDDHRNE